MVYAIGDARSTKFFFFFFFSNDNPRMTFDPSKALSNFCPSFYGNIGKMLHGICRYAIAVLLR